MSMVGTFDGFTAARLGLYAAQHGLRVTGNNVANINTLGYTRQRADQVSLKVGANDLYRSAYDNHVGSGALVTSISQLRDPYLDIRYRNASTDTYQYDTWLAGLQNIASILDEVGKGENKDGLIYRAIQDLAEKLRTYSADPTELNDRLVRNSATSLTLMFHNAATQLEKLYDETVNEFNENVSAVNKILTNIRDLNKSIREAEIHGDAALEMRDERNRQLDALSQYLDIKVEYSYEDIGAGIQVEKLTVKLNNANPDNSVHTDESILVDGLYATQLSVPEKLPVSASLYSDKYSYLKGYTYLKTYCPKDLDELAQFLTDNGITRNDLLQAWDENGDPLFADNGNPIYLVGTNNPIDDDIFTASNDNFTLQLGKLLNAKGAEWKNHTTLWTEISAAMAAANATFSFPITISEDATGILTFKVVNGDKEETFTVDRDNMTDEQILNTIAEALDKSGKYPGYRVSSDGTNIIFKVTDPDNPPANPPSLALAEAGNPAWLSIGDRESVPEKTYDEYGNVIKSVSYAQVEGRWYQIAIGTEYTHEVTLDDNDLRGILQAERELLTEEGEFASEVDVAIDESALTKRGIPYYMKSLDLLAQKFAEAYNQLNSGYAYNQDGYYIDKDGNKLVIDDLDDLNGDGYISATDGLTAGQLRNLINNGCILADDDGYAIDENGQRITDANGNEIKVEDLLDNGVLDLANIDPQIYNQLVADVDTWMDTNGYPMGGNLFTNLDGKSTDKITAKTISVSSGWSNGDYGLVATFKKLFSDDGSLTNSTENDNADHMVAMIDKGLTYNPRDLYGSDAIGPNLFTGSFNDMLSNMMSVEGEDASITNIRLTTAAATLNEVEYSREGVSGVDLNDEAMNMMTYSKAMTAAMRVMTTIDEMLDRLINNTAM